MQRFSKSLLTILLLSSAVASAQVVGPVAGGGGTGDVTGPLSSTDGDVVLFSGATGKVIQDPGYGPTMTIAGTSVNLGGSITGSSILDSLGSTRGSVLYRGASGWAVLTPGTSGNFLKTNGAGADPAWAAAPGGGTVTSISGGNGISTGGSPITTTGTISLTNTLNSQTGTSYAMASTDAGKIVTANNASAQAYSIVQANTANFTSGYGSTISNIGAGTVTLTAATSTFGNGLTTLAIAPGQVADFGSDSTNYPFTAMSLPKMAVDTVLGNFSGTANYPIAGALSSCSGASSALTYNTTTHAFGCNTISGSGSPGGSTTQIQVNNAGSFGGVSTLTVDLTNGYLTNSAAGAASNAAYLMSGALLTGGTGTTNFPAFFLQPSGATASTAWSTNGTFIGINAASGFTGNYLDFHLNGAASALTFSSGGNLTVTGGMTAGGNLIAGATGALQWNGRSKMGSSNSNGNVFFQNSGGTDAQCFGWGAISASFPGICKASATSLAIRLADNSADASLTASNLSLSGTLTFTGTAPTPSGTGTPTIATGSTDSSGEVTAGTSATSVIITFSSAKTNAPFCVVTSQTQLAAFSYTISTTAITITQTATSGNKIDYYCTQH